MADRAEPQMAVSHQTTRQLGCLSMPDEHIPLPPQPEEETLVCGRKMTISPEYYFSAEYHGRVIHFCTVFCLETFHSDPERFYIPHSRKKDQR